MPEAVLSPQEWEAVKTANLRGVSDKELSATFGVLETTIRQRRFTDPMWKAAMAQNRELIATHEARTNASLTKGPESEELAQKTASTIQEAIQGGKLQNELLLLQIASKGLKQADGKMPEVKSWGDVKAIADIVSKIGPQASASVQVNVLTDGQAQFSAFDFPNFESEAIEIEEME
jgi:hypothetical protein